MHVSHLDSLSSNQHMPKAYKAKRVPGAHNNKKINVLHNSNKHTAHCLHHSGLLGSVVPVQRGSYLLASVSIPCA